MKNDPVLLSETQDYICPFRLAITAQRCLGNACMLWVEHADNTGMCSIKQIAMKQNDIL